MEYWSDGKPMLNFIRRIEILTIIFKYAPFLRLSLSQVQYSIIPLLQYSGCLLQDSQLSVTLSQSRIFNPGGVLCGIT